MLLIIGLGSLAAIAAVAALALALLTSRRNKSQPPTTRAAQVTPAPNSSPDSHTDPEPGGLLSGAPILNSSQEMVAYDLVLPQADLADEALSSTAVAQFARQLLDALHTLGLERLGNRRVHVPIPHDILRSGYVELLPANYVVLTIAPDEEPWLLDRCKELAAAGYQLSVDLGSASPSVEFLSLCRYARVSVQDADIDALRERVRGLRRHTRLIATGVDTREHSTIAKELLINYYRGYYFAIPRPLGGRSLSPGERLVSRVISQLTQRAEPSEVEATVKQDVGLSYQLLRYVNSAGHGLRTQVTSLRQALTLLGHERLLRWVSVYLLSRGKDSPGEGHDALYAVSLRRGRTMELLGEGRKTAPECELLFLIGMFSLLDLLLQVPLEETLTEMGLPEPVTRTLVERNGPLTDYLDLTLAMERADMVEARSKMSLLRMEPAEVNRVQLDAMAWVECIVQGRDKEERTAA